MPIAVRGLAVNARSQCAHYHSPLDIVAIKFKCCDTFYACIHCHEALAGHAPETWLKQEHETHAILCGACQSTLSISDYLQSNSSCPSCGAAFNPRCATHHQFYFEDP